MTGGSASNVADPCRCPQSQRRQWTGGHFQEATLDDLSDPV